MFKEDFCNDKFLIVGRDAHIRKKKIQNEVLTKGSEAGQKGVQQGMKNQQLRQTAI